MGRYDSSLEAGFPALRIGIMIPLFQAWGIVAVLKDSLNRSSRNCFPFAPRFFRKVGVFGHLLQHPLPS